MYKNTSESKPAPTPKAVPEYDCKLCSTNLKDIFSKCSDFETRKILFGLEQKLSLELCWLDGLVSAESVSERVIRPLTDISRARGIETEQACAELIECGMVYSNSIKRRDTVDELASDLTHGFCALVFDDAGFALSFEVRNSNVRAVSEPTLEKSIKGAKDSFVETLRINTALVRRRICSPRLKLVESTVGRRSNTRVALMFLEGIAAPDTVRVLAQRLDALDIDALVSLGALEEYIVDHPRSPFPQLIHTERPDRFSMHLLDGRIGLLVDGLPVGLVLPVTLAEFLKVTGESNMHFLVSTSLRILRYLALIISLLLPALYVAVAMYHQEMIPTRLLLSIIEAKQNVPFSTALEVLGMLLAFELLQEAGLRLPNPIGDTVSIIGALIVGQSAVDARVVSPIAIIIVALSGIASYTLPSQDLGSAVRLLRFLLLFAAIAGGLFGIGIVVCLLLLYLAGMDSFGCNYTAPLSDAHPLGLARLFISPPKPSDKFRDPLLRTPDKRRQK